MGKRAVTELVLVVALISGPPCAMCGVRIVKRANGTNRVREWLAVDRQDRAGLLLTAALWSPSPAP
jgi:hypothetical protein